MKKHTYYAIVDQSGPSIKEIRTTQKKDHFPFIQYECEMSSFLRLQEMQKSGKDLGDEEIVIMNNMVYCKSIYDFMQRRIHEQKLEDVTDRIMELSEGTCPYTSGYTKLFNDLSIEEKLNVLFQMSFRTLVRLNNMQRRIDRTT